MLNHFRLGVSSNGRIAVCKTVKVGSNPSAPAFEI